MWKLKSLRLPDGSAPAGNLLRREEIALGLEAAAIIELAHKDAQTIREQARAEAQAEREACQREWEAAFWQQAQTLLTDWQQQRAAEEAQLVVLAGKIVNEALQHLLDEVDDERRFMRCSNSCCVTIHVSSRRRSIAQACRSRRSTAGSPRSRS